MKIKVLGSGGCSTCAKLERNVKEAVKELGLNAEIVKVEDYQEMMSYGIAATPALVVDEKLLFEGWAPNIYELKKILQGHV